MNETVICDVHGEMAPSCICDLIAAAEERGRRRVAEEERALLRESARVLKLWPAMDRSGSENARELCIRINAALAPRDSAPVTENDVAASCFGVAPRDSGKVFSSADEPFADLVVAKARK